MGETLEDECWAVMRQGDQGKPWIVQAPLTKAEAEDLVQEMDSRGHKQAYWKNPCKFGRVHKSKRTRLFSIKMKPNNKNNAFKVVKIKRTVSLESDQKKNLHPLIRR